MTSLELGRWLQRINDATTVRQLSEILAEVELEPDRSAADRLVEVIEARSKTLERRN